MGRFTTKDTWEGDYTQPITLNQWLYGNANPVINTDPSGNITECDIYERADLTQWLIDELNTTRKSNLANLIRYGNNPTVYGNPYAGVSSWLMFYDAEKTHGLFDFKFAIEKKVGPNIRLGDNWYSNQAPGNIHFAFFGVSVGFEKKTLHCGADFATDKKWCSGADDIGDYEAIEAGADMFTLSGGGDVTVQILKTALAFHPLANPGIKMEPLGEAHSLPFWPYPVRTFDDGLSAWFVKHR